MNNIFSQTKSWKHFSPFVILILLGLSFDTFSQDNSKNFKYKHASLKGTKIDGKTVNILTPSSKKKQLLLFRQDMDIWCTKAILDKATNSFHAQKDVHVIKSKTLHIFSDDLKYNGGTGIGKFRENVKLVQDNQTLTTEFLDFNSDDNSGHFYNGGKLVDSTRTLTSKSGYYYPNEDKYLFLDSVIVVTNDYIVYSDTLEYNLKTKVVTVTGPSEIVSDSSYLYCEYGYYDTENKLALVSRNTLFRNESQEMTADSMSYNQAIGFSEAFGNIHIWDSTQQVIITGKKAWYNEEPEYALITDSALFIRLQQSNDSLFLHADTLRYVLDTTATINDSLGIEHKILMAYRKAQAFKSNFQLRSDSLVYKIQDSIIQMFESPILWTNNYQMTAKAIDVFLKNNELDYANMMEKGFIISEEDTIRFNQIKGEELTGYFRDNDIYKVDVKKEGKSLYYAIDQGNIIGVNKAESNEMYIFFEERKPEKVIFLSKPQATLYPDFDCKERRLEGFNWQVELKPENKHEVFWWKKSKTESENNVEKND